jgi:hypothetical protein
VLVHPLKSQRGPGIKHAQAQASPDVEFLPRFGDASGAFNLVTRTLERDPEKFADRRFVVRNEDAHFLISGLSHGVSPAGTGRPSIGRRIVMVVPRSSALSTRMATGRFPAPACAISFKRLTS